MNIKFYAHEQVVKTFNENLAKTKSLDEVEHDIDLLPYGIVSTDGNKHVHGAFDRNKNFCEKSTFYRVGIRKRTPKKPTKITHFMNVDAIYCGYDTSFHFGHFFIEGIARIWPILHQKYQNCRLVFVHHPKHKFPKYAYELLELVGVKKDRIVVIDKTTQFKNLIVPTQCVDMGVFVSKKTQQIYNQIAQNTNLPDIKTFDKIYLSRTQLGKHRTYGEIAIEQIFMNNGFHVVYPEQLPILHQVWLAKNARIIAGVAGTALHLGVFMRPGGQVIQIKRNRMPNDMSTVQYLLGKLNNSDLTIIDASIENTPTTHSSAKPQIIGDTQYMKQFLDDNGFIYTQKDFDKYKKSEWRQYNQMMRLVKFKQVSKKITRPILRLISLVGITRKNQRHIRDLIEKFLYN